MAYAIHLITSSYDNYTFAFDGEPTEKQVAKKIKKQMGKEVEYIDQIHDDATFDHDINLVRGLRALGCEMDGFS